MMSDEQRQAENRNGADRKKQSRSEESDTARQIRLRGMRDSIKQRRVLQKQVTCDALSIVEADEYSVGDMDRRCKHRGAMFFEGEWVKGNPEGVYNFCCLKGRLS